MKKLTAIVLVIALLGLAFLAWKLDHGLGTVPTDCQLHFRHDATDLIYTEHAKCRMRCREVSKNEVADVYDHGVLNCEKSGMRDGSYRYALEKTDHKGEKIRMILVEENNHHKVITVIRVDQPDQNCDCD